MMMRETLKIKTRIFQGLNLFLVISRVNVCKYSQPAVEKAGTASRFRV